LSFNPARTMLSVVLPLTILNARLTLEVGFKAALTAAAPRSKIRFRGMSFHSESKVKIQWYASIELATIKAR
jgi:hypothetical protein